MRLHTAFIVAGCLAAAATPSVAGTFQATFRDPIQYSDAGNTRRDEDANLRALARHLERLAADLLPADQALQVDFVDVQLAGTVLPSRRDGLPPMRTVGGGADWPQFQLRYTLARAGTPIASGEDRISDMDYTRSGLGRVRGNDPLYYEKRLLERWFRERFVTRTAAP